MHEAMKLAGYCSAHAVWCIAEGATLVPMAGCLLPDGSRQLLRFMDEDNLEQAVRMGREWLSDNPLAAACAVLIYDGYVELDTRMDSLLIEIRDFGGGGSGVKMAIPYRPAEQPKKGLTLYHSKGRPFVVYRPKFLELGSLGESELAALAEAFFVGAEGHSEGIAVWDAHLDAGS